MSHFVLEIGVEELPARFLAPLERELAECIAAALRGAELAFGGVKVCSTPRRTIIEIENLVDVQPCREEVVSGPAVKAAYDAEGNPTKATLGFLRGQGKELADIFVLQNEKGDYIAVQKELGGASAMSILIVILPRLISSLSFPKRMRWAEGDFAYARPIHWCVALLDDKVVPFSIGGVASNRLTFGHRVMGYGPFEVAHAEHLFPVLLNRGFIMPYAKDRLDLITREGDKLAGLIGGKVLWKNSLLAEVGGLTEHPVPLLGDFDSKFLDLPAEVLLTSMESHQKSFGLVDSQGCLLPHFLTVLNIQPRDMAVVKRGWERVLRARLEDASFYWNTDLKGNFDAWSGKLENVIFLGPLGSMADKCRRLEKLCAWLASQASVQAAFSLNPQTAEQAGKLAKADLVTQMVGEFDTLQGIMGGIYARKMGLPAEVADALAEQYLPAGPDTPIPSSHYGALLSMADKADILVGCFGLGNIPTGAADPYALRRSALGIARIILEKGYRISVPEFFAQAWTLYPGNINWKHNRAETLDKLDVFFTGRVKNYFVSREYDTLLVEAVLGAERNDVWAVGERLIMLQAEMRKDDFILTAQTLKRVANILRKHEEVLPGVWNDGLLQEVAEKQLAETLLALGKNFDQAWARDDYARVLGLLAEVRPAVDTFFEQIMVMTEDESLRRNRLNILQYLMNYMAKLADFAALQI